MKRTELAAMQLIVAGNRCLCLNRSLSVELLHTSMEPKHLSPHHNILKLLVNDSFSAAWVSGGGGKEREKDGSDSGSRSERIRLHKSTECERKDNSEHPHLGSVLQKQTVTQYYFIAHVSRVK